MKQTPKQIHAAAASMQTLAVHGRTHVVRPFHRDQEPYPEPDYLGTNLALCGVLRKGQTLNEFRQEWIQMQETFEARSEKGVRAK